MIKKIVLILIVIFFSISCKTNKPLSYNEIEQKAAYFLYKKREIRKKEAKDTSFVKRRIVILPIYHRINYEKMKKGIYSFKLSGTGERYYFFIYDNNKITFLDTTTLKELKKSIEIFLDYANQQKYCIDIINDYIVKFNNSYFILNKHPYTKADINCEKGIFNKDSLP